jgi:hypothetical protein
MKDLMLLLKFACGISCCRVGFAIAGDAAQREKALDPRAFDTNANATLEGDELVRYVVRRDKINPDLDAVMSSDLKLRPDAEILVLADLRKQAADGIGEIRGRLGVGFGAPVPLDKLQNLVLSDNPPDEEDGFPIPGGIMTSVTNRYGSAGPVRLRKTADDWRANADDSQGATLAYSHNSKDNKTAWASEGSLIYPILLSGDNTADDRESGVRSWWLWMLPSMSWKVNKIDQTDDSDIEELLYQIPIVWSANHTGLGWLRNSEFKLAPYMHTDFSLDGLVLGTSISYVPYVFDSVSGLALNAGYKGLGKTPFRYRTGLTPTVDFNHLCSDSQYIKREDNDDYLRAGGKAEAGIITKGYPSLEFVASYQAFAGLIGAPDQSDLMSLAGKLWFNENMGLSIEYQRGETPIAQKDIDLAIMGLELKY